jgi:hypothetical protein
MPRFHGLSTSGHLNQKRFPPPIPVRRRSSTRASAVSQVVAPLMCLVVLASLLVGCSTTTTPTPTPTGGEPPLLYTADPAPTIGVSSSMWPGAVCGGGRYLQDSSYTPFTTLPDGTNVPPLQVKNDPTAFEWTPADFSGAPYTGTEGSPDELENSGVTSGTIVYEPSYKDGEPYGVSSNDLPFTHPFGNDAVPFSFNDFEYFVAPDAQYYSELGPGNGAGADPASEYASAYAAVGVSKISTSTTVRTLGKVPGVMGMEMDSGLVPKPYRAQVGDRIAMWGRWIVDCGHQPYHTEIHPPLMMATAHTLPAGSGTGPGTSVQILGRPYLVSQVCFDNAILNTPSYTGDPNCHPNEGVQSCTDGVTDHGEGRDLYDHLICELNHDAFASCPASFPGCEHSNDMNAKPDVYTVPFDGTPSMTFYVDPPTATPPGSGYSLQVRYNLTVRDGVTVVMNQAGSGELRVEVIMNSNAYVPAPLNPSQDRYLTWAQLEAMDKDLPSSVTSNLDNVSYYFGTNGIHVAQYSNVYPSTFDNPIDFTSGASQLLTNLKSTSSGLGIRVDDSQPFPIIGGIQLQWVMCGTPTGCTHVGPVPQPIRVTPQPQPLMVLGTGSTVDHTDNCIGEAPTFTGTILTNGQPGQVTYEWQRSDGTTSQPESISIPQGTSTVSVRTKWGPSKPGGYWAELVVTAPQSTASNKAPFKISVC